MPFATEAEGGGGGGVEPSSSDTDCRCPRLQHAQHEKLAAGTPHPPDIRLPRSQPFDFMSGLGCNLLATEICCSHATLVRQARLQVQKGLSETFYFVMTPCQPWVTTL